MCSTECQVVVPWVTDEELETFLRAWKVSSVPSWLILQRDNSREGCGATKNKGIKQAVKAGAEVVVVLDGDCYPSDEAASLEELMDRHRRALEPQQVVMYQHVTDPPSRGTPYAEITVRMPVAASMGFWLDVPDYCAVRQLALANRKMYFRRESVYGRYFSLCGMNMAFRPNDWWPWCQFVHVSRYDDIWMGWLWQKEAYRRQCCFNLNGPLVRHVRQSNVWANLRDEAVYAEQSETLWREIAVHESECYDDLLELVPTVTEGL